MKYVYLLNLVWNQKCIASFIFFYLEQADSDWRQGLSSESLMSLLIASRGETELAKSLKTEDPTVRVYD